MTNLNIMYFQGSDPPSRGISPNNNSHRHHQQSKSPNPKTPITWQRRFQTSGRPNNTSPNNPKNRKKLTKHKFRSVEIE